MINLDNLLLRKLPAIPDHVIVGKYIVTFNQMFIVYAKYENYYYYISESGELGSCVIKDGWMKQHEFHNTIKGKQYLLYNNIITPWLPVGTTIKLNETTIYQYKVIEFMPDGTMIIGNTSGEGVAPMNHALILINEEYVPVAEAKKILDI